MNRFTPFIDANARDRGAFILNILIFLPAAAAILAVLALWVAR